ncbi:glycoside hydrolase family 97 protein [Chitinophaga sp. MM2321]|uniref:glycoside hydrolase family 97 protein n=1 Tax=Chitinophaga sp. MM2321 TaxID=3137178 RepID=UPI0032D57123
MMKRKPVFMRTCLVLCGMLIAGTAMSEDTLRVHSPSGKIGVKVWMAEKLAYAVTYEGHTIIAPSFIDLEVEGKGSLSADKRIRSSAVVKVNEQIISPVPEKRRLIPDLYNRLSLRFRQPYTVEFRVYDDGVAYRIGTAFKENIIIRNEVAEFNFPGNPSAYFPETPSRENNSFSTSFEDQYVHRKMADYPAKKMTYTPLLVTPESNPKIAITESDLEAYPGLHLKANGGASLKAVFPPYPLEIKVEEALYSAARVSKGADYIARTAGSRTFPWRVLMIAPEDKDLPMNDIVYRLGAPSRVKDVSWIKPGNITDEWIIDVNLFNVPFKAGVNTASYKYYIDFASRFGFDRIMMDAGWSDNNDLFKVNPDINMDTLVAYAREKGVKISMWTLALTLERQLDSALAQFKKWDVDFIMTDFIERDDQPAVDMHHRIAKACAESRIMLMFHGSFPPKGFNRTYPHALTREGVLGSEYNIWSTEVSPGHDVLLAFTRMLAGPLDYEPGLLNNGTKKRFRPIEGHVMSPGTRAHQLSMTVIYDSPLQFFSGNPSQGYQEPAYMELTGSIPSVWDETHVLDAKVGEWIVTSRRNGDNWYIAGMTDWTERDINLKLDFLDDAGYKATICRDGINADRYAADYVIEHTDVQRHETMKIHMAPGGGFLIKLEKK